MKEIVFAFRMVIPPNNHKKLKVVADAFVYAIKTLVR